MQDSIEALVADLRELPGRRRRAILADLAPAERRTVETWLAKDADEAVAPDRHAIFSPWLRERLPIMVGASSGLTPDGRAALKRAIADAATLPGSAAMDGPKPSRSLFGAMRAFLTGANA